MMEMKSGFKNCFCSPLSFLPLPLTDKAQMLSNQQLEVLYEYVIAKNC